MWQIGYRREQRRAPLLAMIAAYLDIDVIDITLVDGEFGRPMLAAGHGTTLDFNWSHSGGQALVAVAQGIAPGIDIERVRARPRALLIADRYFCADEIAALGALSDTQRSHAFLEIWTAKEAVLKALGRGIAFGLDRLAITTRDGLGPSLRWLEGDDASLWQLHRINVGQKYVGALAWRGDPRAVLSYTLANVP